VDLPESRKYQINSDDDRAVWLERNNFSLAQFEHSVLRTLKLDRFKQLTFNGKVDSSFLQRKSQLDREPILRQYFDDRPSSIEIFEILRIELERQPNQEQLSTYWA
jgi:hypothetical protein